MEKEHLTAKPLYTAVFACYHFLHETVLITINCQHRNVYMLLVL